MGQTETPQRKRVGRGCPGKVAGGREEFPQTWANSALCRPRMESRGKVSGRLSPRLFTYEVAHGGRIGVPVALPKRHGGPRKSASTALQLRLHPLGAPGSSSPPERFPGSRRGCASCPAAAGRRAAGVGRGGGDAGRPRTCHGPRGTRVGAALSAQVGEAGGGAAGSSREERGFGAQVGFSRRPSLLVLGPQPGIRHPGFDPATWAKRCSSLSPFASLGKEGYMERTTQISG